MVISFISILDESSVLKYIENSYVTYGNDGNHFNDAINSGSNAVVSNDIADALHDASDHLPVYMDLWFDDLIYSIQGIVISEVMPNPASVSDSYGEWFPRVPVYGDSPSFVDFLVVGTVSAAVGAVALPVYRHWKSLQEQRRGRADDWRGWGQPLLIGQDEYTIEIKR